jgi:hypothetical protein
VEQLFDRFDVLQLLDRFNTDSTALEWVIGILTGLFLDGIGKSLACKVLNIYSLKLCKMSMPILPVIP